MQTNDICRPPSDPSKIRFDDDCFEVVGTEVHYSVSQPATCPGPRHFGTDQARAAAYARRCGRPVNETVHTVKRRTRWF